MFRYRNLCWLLLLVILPVSPTADAADSSADRQLSNRAIFCTSFAEESDVNFDDWPDHWERAAGEGYSHYVEIGIAEDPTTDNGRCLLLNLDGGGAQVSTPPIRVMPKFGYTLQCQMKLENLQHTQVTILVDLLSTDGTRIQTEMVKLPQKTNGWQNFEVRSFRPTSPEISRAVIRFDAPRGRRGDLEGRIGIDQISLEQLPSMTVTTGRECNVYDSFEEIKVTCTLSGIRDRNPRILFQLLDFTSKIIAGKEEAKELNGRLIVEDTRLAEEIVGTIGNRPHGYEGSTYWNPGIDDYGFYKVRVKMLEDESKQQQDDADYDRELDDQEITLVVLPKLPRPPSGEFGWTLPLGDRPLSLKLLNELLPRVGVYWVKMPVWYPIDQPDRGSAIIHFAERASSSNIEVIGIIDDPTLDDYQKQNPNDPTNIANLLLADASFWQPQYDHVMTRLSLRLRWWQLGNDLDTSFYAYPKLLEKMQTIRGGLYRFGQDVKLGLGWRWPASEEKQRLEPWQPPLENPGWEFEQLSLQPPPTADQLADHLHNVERTPALRWVLVDPKWEAPADEAKLSAEQQKRMHDEHIREFVRQMVTAKIGQADGIFVANPFTGPEGVMNIDGTPGELLLPWRTTANLLSDTHYIGDLVLPSGSTNHLFANANDDIVMLVWNDQDTTETLYLGEQIEQIDVWGKRHTPKRLTDGRVEIEVGRLPSFVLGLNHFVARWRMAVEFDKLRIPSVFGYKHENIVRGRNMFRQGVNGHFSLFVPPQEGDESEFLAAQNKRWEILPTEGELTAGGNQEFSLPFSVLLREAEYGVQPVRVDFDFEADRHYKFSVWRNLVVGLGEVEIDVTTRLDEQGNLLVEQKMVNHGERPVDFKCLLYAPPRRRKRTQVVMLDAEGNTKIYLYSNGEELLGRVLKLRAEEINGQRVLIHRFTAERGAPAP